jgi:hypothetical protein
MRVGHDDRGRNGVRAHLVAINSQWRSVPAEKSGTTGKGPKTEPPILLLQHRHYYTKLHTVAAALVLHILAILALQTATIVVPVSWDLFLGWLVKQFLVPRVRVPHI